MIPIVLIIAILIFYLFKQYRIYSYRKYELMLYRLRDKLRDYAIEGKIKPYDWTFHYLDTSISKMTGHFKMINIFHAIYLRNKHIGDKSIDDFKVHLDYSLKKNHYSKEIYDEFNSILSDYLFSKHIILFSMTAVAVYSYIRSVTKYKKFKLETEDSINKLTFMPETSTSDDFIGSYKASYC